MLPKPKTFTPKTRVQDFGSTLALGFGVHGRIRMRMSGLYWAQYMGCFCGTCVQGLGWGFGWG